jgi:hypothetical protein
MKRPGKGTNGIEESPIGSPDRTVLQMAKTIHVLFVGPLAHGNMVHDVLLEIPSFHLAIATDYQELWAISQQEPIDVILLHNSFSSSELEDSCRFIRQRWPHAGILLIHRGESFLEDALYDDRVVPNVAAEILRSKIQQLNGRRQRWRSEDVEL